jgi:hypothetical protein
MEITYKKTSERYFNSVFYFYLFLAFTTIHKLNYLNSQLFAIDIQNLIGISLLVFPPIFLIFSYLKFKGEMNGALSPDSQFVKTILILVHLLVVYGIIRGNFLPRVIEEYWTAITIYFSYKMGSNMKIWDLFRTRLLLPFLLISFFVFLGTTILQKQFTTGEYLESAFENLTTATEAYNVAPILDFWPFIMLFAFVRKADQKFWYLNYLPFIIYFGFQLFFLKRAPTIRALSHVFVGSILTLYFTKNTKNIFGTIVVMITFIIGGYFAIPEDLAERFRTEDTSRQSELGEMTSQLNGVEWIIGKGLGGEYNSGLFGVSERKDVLGYDVKSTLHIGYGDALLKGGFLLFSLILFHFLIIVRNALLNISNCEPYQLVAMGFLIVFMLFRLIEGGLTPGTTMNAFCYGMSLKAIELVPIRTQFLSKT